MNHRSTDPQDEQHQQHRDDQLKDWDRQPPVSNRPVGDVVTGFGHSVEADLGATVDRTNQLLSEVADLNQRITSHLDARLRKLMVAVWTMILGGLASLIFIGINWGTVTAKVQVHQSDSNLHMPADEKYRSFVTRADWLAMTVRRDDDIDDIKGAVLRLEAKLDEKSR